MLLLDGLRRHPMWVALAAGALIGAIAGLFLPIRAPAAGEVIEQPWKLPTLASTRPYTEAAASSIQGASFWGPDSGAAPRVQPATWQLHAILTRPAPRIAISQVGKGGTVWIPLYGKLPDGSVLVALDRDAAWIERDGCRSARKLYPGASDAQNDPCAAPSAPRPNTAPGAIAPGSPNPQKKNAS